MRRLAALWVTMVALADVAIAQTVPGDAGVPAPDPVAPAEPSPDVPPPASPPPAPVQATPQPQPVVATGAPPRREQYPIAVTDRPLTLPPGVTELEVSEEFRTRVVVVTDMMGNATYERTGFAEDRTPDIAVAHAFGRLELRAGLGLDARGQVAFDTRAIPQRVYVGFGFGNVQQDGRYSHNQFVGVVHKLVLVPERLALMPSAAIAVVETRQVNARDPTMKREGYIVSAGASVFAYTQIAWRFALSAGSGFRVPLAQSDVFDSKPSLSAGAYLYLALRKWDFYVGGNVFDITREYPSTFFTFGFKKRWGL